MARFDTGRVLAYILYWMTKVLEPPRPGKKKIKFYFEFDAIRDSDDKLVAIEATCKNVRWSVRCDHGGAAVSDASGPRHFSWADLPTRLILEMEQLHSALYVHHDDVIPFPIAKRGPWSEFECPGWFGMMLYNALLKAGCKQAM